ncbi:hypothetical protein EJB05_44343 [Eragrostis curvula]|uniref:WIYLD domain-containing protein n=1 Tax=Eragrostis curvula TaxID=38414 RepID=A0A5J9THP0_9POAL|nr:hypothetical protein EJB05_44343 [Eragrostis curvula]
MAPRKGNRHIDATIDHFRGMGYAVRDVCRTVATLLKDCAQQPEMWFWVRGFLFSRGRAAGLGG